MRYASRCLAMLVALTTCGTRAEADVYAGGAFAAAGGVAANHIAKWNGDSWSALGIGIGGSAPYVYAIALSGNDVYAGGDFQTAGGGPANYIAKWDGNSWSAIGGGVNSSVRTVALGGNDVYAGGDFTTAGGGPASHIAKWNGSTWSAKRLALGTLRERWSTRQTATARPPDQYDRIFLGN